MDAQDTMRLMFDTMDAHDRGDFDRLGEIYAEDAHWMNSDPDGPHCENREDIFDMFRGRMESGIRVVFDEMRSTPTHVALVVRAPDFASAQVFLPSTDAGSFTWLTTARWRLLRPPCGVRSRLSEESRRNWSRSSSKTPYTFLDRDRGDTTGTWALVSE